MRPLASLLVACLTLAAALHASIARGTPSPALPSGGERSAAWDPIGCLVNCYCCSPIGGKGNPDCCLWCDNNCYGFSSFNTALNTELRIVSPWVNAVDIGVEAGASFHDAITSQSRPTAGGRDWAGYWDPGSGTFCFTNMGLGVDTALVFVLVNREFVELPLSMTVFELASHASQCLPLGPLVMPGAQLECFVFSASGPAADGGGQFSLDASVNADVPAGRPARLALTAAPNPARRIALGFSLASACAGELTIHDVAGRRVRTLAAGSLPAGAQHYDWDGADANGTRLRAGVYFARLRAGDALTSATLLLVD